MVLLHELEFYHVADVCCNGFWVVSKDRCHSGFYRLHAANDDLFDVRCNNVCEKTKLTVCVAGPLATAGARLMTCIWAAARPATIGSAEMYFIMTMVRIFVNVKGT
jgi:hypothetical protein